MSERGAGHAFPLGLPLQRPCLPCWIDCHSLLSPTCRQDPQLARSAGRYIRLATPALLFTGLFEAGKRYLMAQVRGQGGWEAGAACRA